ncbi:uroporphyrinogen decarboxylase family protein [Planctomycetota bacterium]
MMTRKERFERALRREEVDRLPFWVKVFGGSYLDFQPERYREMAELELADYLDLDHMAGGPSPVACTNDRVERHDERLNGRRITEWKTPDGTLRQVNGYDESSHTWHPIEFPIKEPAAIKAALHIYERSRFEVNEEALPRCAERLRQVGDRGIVMTGMGISPLMDLIQHLIGPMNTYFFLTDCPKPMDTLIAAMHDERLRFLRCLLTACPYDYIVSVENTSTTLLSPAVFERYCWRHLMDYGRLITEAGKMHVLHQCGKLHALLPKIEELPASAIEAYSSPPVGNTTLADRVERAPTTAIIGGTNATTWLQPVDAICESIEQSLVEAGTLAGVVLTSAGVMPPACSIETIRQVRERMKEMTPARVACQA